MRSLGGAWQERPIMCAHTQPRRCRQLPGHSLAPLKAQPFLMGLLQLEELLKGLWGVNPRGRSKGKDPTPRAAGLDAAGLGAGALDDEEAPREMRSRTAWGGSSGTPVSGRTPSRAVGASAGQCSCGASRGCQPGAGVSLIRWYGPDRRAVARGINPLPPLPPMEAPRPRLAKSRTGEGDERKWPGRNPGG